MNEASFFLVLFLQTYDRIELAEDIHAVVEGSKPPAHWDARHFTPPHESSEKASHVEEDGEDMDVRMRRLGMEKRKIQTRSPVEKVYWSMSLTLFMKGGLWLRAWKAQS